LSALAFADENRKDKDSPESPHAVWSVPKVDVTLKPGEALPIRVTLTAREELDAGVVRVVPALAANLQVSPTTTPHLRKGQTQTFTLTFSARIDAVSTMLDGVLQLRETENNGRHGEIIVKPLPITFGVVCPCLPPDPGVAGMATIEGVDSDNDGLRDDAQRYIATSFPGSARIRLAATQLARALQYSLTSDLSDLQAIASLRAQLDASNCATYIDANNTTGFVNSIQVRMLNTADRRTQYDQMLLPFAGRLFEPPAEGPAPESCEFDLESLPN
jgi:hypothetical protein